MNQLVAFDATKYSPIQSVEKYYAQQAAQQAAQQPAQQPTESTPTDLPKEEKEPSPVAATIPYTQSTTLPEDSANQEPTYSQQNTESTVPEPSETESRVETPCAVITSTTTEPVTVTPTVANASSTVEEQGEGQEPSTEQQS